jgi:hypothetical protein
MPHPPARPTISIMTAADHRLLTHLGIAVALKLVALTLLWFFLLRPHHATVDPQAAAELLVPSASSPAPLTPESRHDQ